MGMFSYRRVYLYAFFLICLLLGALAYLQFFLKIQPCALNYMERLLLLLLAVIFLGAVLQSSSSIARKIYSWTAIFIGLLGLLASGRHVWFQHAASSSLSPAINTYTDVSFLQLIRDAVLGTVGCAKVHWTLWGLSLSEWIFCVFLLIVVLCFWQQTRKDK